jgi:hypothetical protein
MPAEAMNAAINKNVNVIRKIFFQEILNFFLGLVSVVMGDDLLFDFISHRNPLTP